MAKHRKAKKTHHRRHHRIGAMKGAGAILSKVAGIAVGAVGAAFINGAVKKSFTTLPQWAGGAVGVAAGVAIPKFARSPFVADISAGMVAAGSLFIINETFLSLPGIAGIGALPKTMANRATPKIERTVSGATKMGAPGFMDKAVHGFRDAAVIGALYDN